MTPTPPPESSDIKRYQISVPHGTSPGVFVLKEGVLASEYDSLRTRLREAEEALVEAEPYLAFVAKQDGCAKPILTKVRQALSALRTRLAAYEDEERRSECNGELSACGEMTSDGPSMDCRVCQLADRLAALARQTLSALRPATRATGEGKAEAQATVGDPPAGFQKVHALRLW